LIEGITWLHLVGKQRLFVIGGLLDEEAVEHLGQWEFQLLQSLHRTALPVAHAPAGVAFEDRIQAVRGPAPRGFVRIVAGIRQLDERSELVVTAAAEGMDDLFHHLPADVLPRRQLVEGQHDLGVGGPGLVLLQLFDGTARFRAHPALDDRHRVPIPALRIGSADREVYTLDEAGLILNTLRTLCLLPCHDLLLLLPP